MSIPVFRKGAWIQYPYPSDRNPLWSNEHLLKAASFYATALSQGYSPSDSSIYAESYVNSLLYPGIRYVHTLEKRIQSIMDRAEKA